MKKIISLLAILLVVMTTASVFTSCETDDDDFKNPTENGRDEDEDVPPSYRYDANGLWRLEANGEKYTLKIKVPNYDTGGSYVANFYYNDNFYNGTAELQNNILTFETDSDAELKVVIKATFANEDSQKFVGNLSINGRTVASNATFNHLADPTNYSFSIHYKVIDPDNELAALGADIQKLDDEVKDLDNSTSTEYDSFDKAFTSLLTLEALGTIQLMRVMKNQNARYPGLPKTNAYVEISVIESFSDINVAYEKSSLTYAKVGELNE